MSLPDDQRRLLGGFLRARREAISPGEIGLPGSPRRRTPGLRREEVAQLCRISTTWLSWIEQGRDVSLSASALARLAEGLRLTAAERAYLFELAQRRDPSPNPRIVDAPPEDLRLALRAMATPAYLLDRLWRVRGRNAPAERLFSPWFESDEPCLLRFVFLNPSARTFISDWDERARRIVAEFRADTARLPDDPSLQELARRLQRDSEVFARMWNAFAVLEREGGLRRFHHPQDGPLHFRQMTLAPAMHPDLKLVLLLPVDAGAEDGTDRPLSPPRGSS